MTQRLARHTLLNLLGLALPLCAALLVIPDLLRQLGPARFGVLTLVWALASYFGLFDLGLARALTQQLAAAKERGDTARIGPLAATTLGLLALLGLLAGVLLAALSQPVAGGMRDLPDPDETVAVIRVVAWMMPAIVLTAGLRGILEACHAFGAVNLVRLPLGLWTFAGPWLSLQLWGGDLVSIAWLLLAGRVVALLVHAWQVRRALPEARGRWTWKPALLRPLLVSGGWLTLSNVVSPLMGYVDRFLIGATLSAAAVAYYATPQEIVTRLWIVPGALTAVLLPTFAARAVRGDGSDAPLLDRAVHALFLVLLPITAALALFADELLSLWLGTAFAAASAPLLKVFAVGILINCLAHLPLTWLHGVGRFKAPALLHCVELPLFIAALWLLCREYGLAGAAFAWLGRMTLDTLALFVLCWRARGAPPAWRAVLPGAVLAAVAFAGLALSGLEARLWWWAAVSGATATIAWRRFAPHRVP
jgi:O-antigen/teichoic acid export membrane protein